MDEAFEATLNHFQKYEGPDSYELKGESFENTSSTIYRVIIIKADGGYKIFHRRTYRGSDLASGETFLLKSEFQARNYLIGKITNFELRTRHD